MNYTITQQVTKRFIITQCYKCGTDFGLDEQLHKRFYDKGDSFYCPNGHSQAYCKSEVDRLKEELIKEKDRGSSWYRRYLEEEKSKNAYKGQVTKIKNRISNGVCPCCKRHFTNLERHMKSKHPDLSGSKA